MVMIRMYPGSFLIFAFDMISSIFAFLLTLRTSYSLWTLGYSARFSGTIVLALMSG